MEDCIMSNLDNTVVIDGNLTKDPELKETPKGTPVCTFSVASNRYYKAGEETKQEVSFFDVEAWSALAERCGSSLKKGQGVKVAGQLRQDRWTDGEGKNHSRVKIVASYVDPRANFSRSETENTGEQEEVKKAV